MKHTQKKQTKKNQETKKPKHERINNLNEKMFGCYFVSLHILVFHCFIVSLFHC